MADELDSLFPELQGLLTADWGMSPGSPLAADPEHGGVSAEALDAYLRDNAGRPLLRGLETSGGGFNEPRAPAVPETAPSPGEGDDGEEELEEEEGTPPASAPAPPPDEPAAPPVPPEIPEVADVVRVGDQTFTRDQLEAFARFRHETQNDPALQQLLTAYYSGQLGQLGQPAPAPAPVAPAPAAAYVPPAQAAPPLAPFQFSEEDDPRIVQLLQVAQAQQRQIEALTAGVQGVAARETARSEADMQALVNRAAASFQQQHSLTDEEIKRLRGSAARMGSVNALMAGFDPITGVPKRPDILEATDRALEIAYYADPQLRQRMIDDAIESNRERNRKRQRLAAVGSGGAPAPHQPAEAPRPGSPAAHAAMVGEVGAMLAGTWQEPGR